MNTTHKIPHRAAFALLLLSGSWDAAHAQLVPNGAGPAYGHVHLNVSDIQLRKWIWTDHFGFELDDLEAFCNALLARGINFDNAYRDIPDVDLKNAFITDPSGVYIELTEG